MELRDVIALATCLDNSFQDHLDKLEQVLTRLAEAGLKVNVSKSHFCQHELEYLGYLINREGVRPTMKKVEAIKILLLLKLENKYEASLV